MPVARSTVIGAVSGVLLLVGVFGFAVGLPEVTGDTAEASESAHAALPELPDRLAEGLVALDSDPAATGQSAEAMVERDRAAAERLGELYGTDALVRSYLRNDQTDPASLSLTVVPGEAGVFVPGGPPYDPELAGYARGNYELLSIGDAQCAVTWEQVVPMGAEPDPAAVPLVAQCQVEVDGVVYNAAAQRLTAEQVASILEDVSGR
jgi:hypothetical protein